MGFLKSGRFRCALRRKSAPIIAIGRSAARACIDRHIEIGARDIEWRSSHPLAEAKILRHPRRRSAL